MVLLGVGEDINVFLSCNGVFFTRQSYLVISDGCFIMLFKIHMGL